MPKYVLAGVQAAHTTAATLGCGKYDCEPRVWQAAGKPLAAAGSGGRVVRKKGAPGWKLP